MYGLTEECDKMCRLRYVVFVNPLPQCGHLWGPSGVSAAFFVPSPFETLLIVGVALALELGDSLTVELLSALRLSFPDVSNEDWGDGRAYKFAINEHKFW